MGRAATLHSTGFVLLAGLLAVGWLLAGEGSLGTAGVVVLAAAALILGLPHGALDLWLAASTDRFGEPGRFSRAGFVRFHLAYLALAALVVVAFVLLPTLSLIGFLLLSLWHFSDDWRGLPTPIRLGCASVIVLVPTVFHPGEVAAIFAALTDRPMIGAAAVPYPVLLATAWIVGGSIVTAFATDRRYGAEVAAVALLAACLPPLVFFTAYFTLLHGPRHMLRHGALIAGPRARPVLALYTLAALGIVAGLWMLLGADQTTLTEGTMRALFTGLAALTVPHAILIEYDKRLKDKVGSRESRFGTKEAPLAS